MNNDEQVITIKLEEYKELLMIKGKYEELKNMYYPATYPNSYPKSNIVYRSFDDDNTCACEKEIGV